MIIKRIENVKNISNIGNEINLSQRSFIYGCNGVGKSTIKHIFKEAFNNGKLITQFNKQKKDVNVEIELFQKNKILFEKGVNKSNLNNIKFHCYDDEYVEENVFINGAVESQHEKEMLKIVVGNKINLRVDNLMKLSEKTLEISKLIDNELSNFYKIKSVITEFTDQLGRLINDLKIKYNKQYEISKKLKTFIKKNVATLNSRIYEWLIEGSNFRKDNAICPYCGQNIPKILFDDYISNYNDIINITIGEENEIRKKLNNYATYFENFDYNDVFRNGILENITEFQNNILQAIYFKMDNVNQIPGQISVLKKEKIKILSLLEKFNDSYSKLTDLNNKMKVENVFKYDYDVPTKDNIISLLDKISIIYPIGNLQNNFLDLHKYALKISRKNSEINREQEEILGLNLNSINELLSKYNIDYKLIVSEVGQKSTSKSAAPKVDYYLVNTKYTNSQVNKKDIKNILSIGERNTLSWVLFLFQLENEIKNGRHCIILDDPISSYDAFKRFSLIRDFKVIFGKMPNYEVLILSHEKSFTNTMAFYLKDSYNFFIMKNGNINPIDKKDILVSPLKLNLKVIFDMSSDINERNFPEFIIRLRRIIENVRENYQYIKGKVIHRRKLNTCWDNLSEIIHGRINHLDNIDIDLCINIIKDITKVKLKFKFNCDINNFNFIEMCKNSKDNPFSSRVLVENYINQLLNDANIEYNDNYGLNEKLSIIKKNNLGNDTIISAIEYNLPILNIYAHHNNEYGLSEIDFDDKQIMELINLAKTIVNFIEL